MNLKKEQLMIYNFLFPTRPNTAKVSLFLLAVRIIFGILLMNHGIQKWSNFQELSTAFPDPMAIAFFMIHANDIFTVKELAFIYLVVFILMYIAGPGKYSIDHIIGNELQRRKSK